MTSFNCQATINLDSLERKAMFTRLFDSYFSLGRRSRDGDHTTAFVVFKNMLDIRTRTPDGRNNLTLGQLLGTDEQGTNGVLRELYEEIKQLPGYQLYQQRDARLPNEYLASIDELEMSLIEARSQVYSRLQSGGSQVGTRNLLSTYVTSLITLRNQLPYSAMAFGGGGGRERFAANALKRANFNGGNGNRGELLNHAFKLLDVNSMKQRFEVEDIDFNRIDIEDELYAYYQAVPGMPNLEDIFNNQGPDAVIQAIFDTETKIIDQHIKTLKSAYPRISYFRGGNFKTDFQRKYDNFPD